MQLAIARIVGRLGVYGIKCMGINGFLNYSMFSMRTFVRPRDCFSRSRDNSLSVEHGFGGIPDASMSGYGVWWITRRILCIKMSRIGMTTLHQYRDLHYLVTR